MAFKSFLIIDESILQDNKLTITEKLILAYIRGYWRQCEPCTASNNQIAKYLNITKMSVIRAINNLRLNGYIVVRYLKSDIPDYKGNNLRVIEKPKIGQAEQLSLLFKSVVYGDKNIK